MSIGCVRFAVLAWVVASLVGCVGPHKLKDFDDGLNACMPDLRTASGGGACRTRVAKIAQDALAEARQPRSDQAMTVSFYRVAAVASAEAGPLGTATLPPAADEGASACDRLPQKDASAPRDCTLVRLAMPLGVGRELASQATALIAKRDGNGAAAGGAVHGKLPASDARAARDLFSGFEAQTKKVCDVASTMPRPLLAPEFVKSVEGMQRALYCWTSKSYSLVLDVQDETLDTTTALAQRKQALRQLVEGQLGGAIDCRTVAADVSVPQ
jgi:hypothetical protein